MSIGTKILDAFRYRGTGTVDEKELDTVSQSAHFAWGALVALAGHSHVVIVSLSFLALAALKEFVYDEHFETATVRGSNLRDFLFYTVGIIAGIVTWIVLR